MYGLALGNNGNAVIHTKIVTQSCDSNGRNGSVVTQRLSRYILFFTLLFFAHHTYHRNSHDAIVSQHMSEHYNDSYFILSV